MLYPNPSRPALTAVCVAAALQLAPLETAAQAAAPPSTPSTAPQPAPQPAGTQQVTITGSSLPRADLVQRRTAGTALFGDGDVRDQPFTVHTITATEVKNLQAANFSEALANDPAITGAFGGDDGYIFDAFEIRGFFVGNQIYDGHLIEAYYTSRTPESTDRIEVLRGPAAFRYGFVTPGGVVNIVSKAPTDKPFRSIALNAIDYGRIGAHLDLGGRVGPGGSFGYRVNLAGYGGDAVYDNSTKERQLLALATDWRVRSDLTLYANVELSNAVGRGGGMDGYRRVSADTTGRLPEPIPEPRRQWLPEWGYGKARENVAGLRAAWRFSPAWLWDTSLRYADKREEVWGGVTFGTPQWGTDGSHTLDYNGYIWEPRTWSATSYVQGRLQTGSISHRVTAGVSVTRIDVDYTLPSNAYSLTVPSNFFAPATLPQAAPQWADPIVGGRVRQQGAFISNQLEIGPWLPLFGLRWSSIETGPDGFDSRQSRNRKVSPMLGLSYRASEVATLFVSYATGLENGGRAPVDAANASAQMAPLESRSVEVGVKSDLSNGDLTLDAALFAIEKTAAFRDAANVFVQAGQQVHRGAEVLLKGRPWPTLELSAGAQWIDARFRKVPGQEGNRVANVPRVRAVVSADQAVPGLPGLFVGGLVSYTGERDINVPNTTRVPAYTLLNLRLRYETQFAGKRFIGRVNLDNVADQRYWSVVSFGSAEVGAARVLKVSGEVIF